jgi:hypothetical protein
VAAGGLREVGVVAGMASDGGRSALSTRERNWRENPSGLLALLACTAVNDMKSKVKRYTLVVFSWNFGMPHACC